MSPFCRTEKMLPVHPSHLICILVRIPAMYIDPPPPSLLTILCILVCSQPVYSNRDSITKHCKDQENQWREGRVSISRGMVIIACPWLHPTTVHVHLAIPSIDFIGQCSGQYMRRTSEDLTR